MTRRDVLRAGAASGAAALLGLGRTPAAARPNFVLILADDLGYGDLGCYGGPWATPQLDALAREGLRWTDFHSNGPVCSPTRAALLTGRYQQRCGISAVLTAAAHRDRGLATAEVTFADMLRAAGYATALYGKWHLGYDPQFNPVRHGFDEFRGFVSGNVDYHSHVDLTGTPDWWQGDRLVPEPGYTTDLITQHAERFLTQHQTQPFCLYLAHAAVHSPYQSRQDPPQRVAGRRGTAGQRSDARTAYAAMLTALDDGVGRVVATLRRLGLAERTLVFFMSDNGPTGPGQAGPLNGRKGGLLEGGHRVPAIAWWPGRIAPGESAEVGLTMDLFPTLAALAGAPVPTGLALDGVDLSPVLCERRALAPRTVCWAAGNQTAARSGPWKLHRKGNGAPQLYHLAEDLGEARDRASEQPERVEQLQRALQDWSASLPQPTPDGAPER